MTPYSFSTSQGAITFYFKSDLSTVNPGFMANYQCNSIPPPLAGFAAPSVTSICVSDSILFTNTSSNASTYYWVFESGNPVTSLDTDPYVQYDSTGTFDVTLYAIEGIDSNQYSQTITVDVVDEPIADFSSSSPALASDPVIFFTNNSIQASSYYWDFDDGNNSTDSNPWNNFINAGTYDVMLIASNGICPADTVIYQVEIIEDVSVDQFDGNSFLIFPNPFTNELQIQGLSDLAPMTYSIFDMEGKQIRTSTEFPKNGVIVINDLGELARGSYLIRIEQEDKVLQIPLIKE